MTRLGKKTASAGDPETDEIMRKVRKIVVSSIVNSAPEIRAAKWLHEKEAARGAQK